MDKEFEKYQKSNLKDLKKQYHVYIMTADILTLGFTAFCRKLFNKNKK